HALARVRGDGLRSDSGVEVTNRERSRARSFIQGGAKRPEAGSQEGRNSAICMAHGSASRIIEGHIRQIGDPLRGTQPASSPFFFLGEPSGDPPFLLRSFSSRIRSNRST